MGVLTYTMADITSPVAAQRLFRAIAIDQLNITPTVMPQHIQSIDVIGDPTSVGCIKRFNFSEGIPHKYTKKTEEIDTSKLYVKYSLTEGGKVGDIFESVVYEVTYEALPDGGARYKAIAHFHIKDEFVKHEEEVASAQNVVTMFFKKFEEYLIANPQVYA